VNLIAISSNVLANPDFISCIEQKEIRGTTVTLVWIGDRNYTLGVPLDSFYKNLGMGDISSSGQHFAG
jgi:hypothetical protein